MVLHGDELQELRGLRILLPTEQVKNTLIRFAVTHIRRTIDATGMFQRNFAIKRVQLIFLRYMLCWNGCTAVEAFFPYFFIQIWLNE